MLFVRLKPVMLSVSGLFFLSLAMPSSVIYAEDTSQDLYTWQQAAEACLGAKDYAGAANSYQKIIDTYPDHPEVLKAWTGLATCAIAQRDFPAAQKVTESLLTRHSSRPDIAAQVRELANQYLWAQAPDKARSLFQLMVDRWPDSPDTLRAWTGLAICAIGERDYPTFQKATETLLTQYPDRTEVIGQILEIGDNCLWAQAPDRADSLFRLVAERWPDSPDTLRAWTGIGVCAIIRKDFPAAQKASDNLLTLYSNRPEVVGSIRSLANHYLWSQEHARACPLFQAIAERWPDHSEAPDAWAGLGVCAIIQKDFAAAQKASQNLLTLYPNRPEVVGPIRALANQYLWSQEHARARPLFQAIVDRWPDHPEAPDAWAGLGICAILQKDFTVAQQAGEALLSRYPDRPEVAGPVQALANQYLWAQESARANGLFQALVDRWPDRPESVRAWAGLAVCSIEKGDFPAAQKATEAILGRYANQPEVITQIRSLSDHYFWAGRPSDAHSLFQQVVDRWPDYQKLLNEWPNKSEVLQTWVNIAYCAIQMEDLPTAETITHQILTDFSGHPELRNAIQTLAEHYRSIASNVTKARDLYTHWLEKYSSDPEAFKVQCLLVLARMAEHDMKSADEALEQFKRLCQGDLDHFQETVRLAKTYDEYSRPEKSVELYRWYMDLSTDRLDRFAKEYAASQEFKTDIRHALGSSGHSEIKSTFMEYLIRKAAVSTHCETVIAMYTDLCEGKLEADACKAILQVIKGNPNPTESLDHVMDLCNQQKMSSASVQLGNSFLTEYPKLASRPELLLKIYESMLLGGQGAAAIPLLNEYLDAPVSDNPELTIEASILMGQAYLQTSDPAQAEGCFKRVIEDLPAGNSTSRAVFFLAACYLMQNEFELARQTLESLLTDYPGSDYEDRTRQLLKNIEDLT